MSKPKRTLLFVYGTLKKSDTNNYFLRKSEFIGKAVTVLPMYMVSFGCPAVVLPSKENEHGNIKALPILGEVYRISKKVFKRIDQLEGYPDMYDRSLQEVKVIPTDRVVKAYIYTMPISAKYMYSIGNSYPNEVKVNNKRYEFVPRKDYLIYL